MHWSVNKQILLIFNQPFTTCLDAARTCLLRFNLLTAILQHCTQRQVLTHLGTCVSIFVTQSFFFFFGIHSNNFMLMGLYRISECPWHTPKCICPEQNNTLWRWPCQLRATEVGLGDGDNGHHFSNFCSAYSASALSSLQSCELSSWQCCLSFKLEAGEKRDGGRQRESKARGMIKEGAVLRVTHPRTHRFTGSARRAGLHWSHVPLWDQSLDSGFVVSCTLWN